MSNSTDSILPDSLSTEERILYAAEHEFMLRGLAAARTATIAEAAGVTHAMLHYYFRTKERLFDRVMTEKLDTLAHAFQINIDESMTLHECLRRAVETHFDFLRKNIFLPRFMVCEVFGNPELMARLREKVTAIATRTISLLQKKIDHEASAGRCRHVKARSVILDIVSLNVFPILSAPMAKEMKAVSGEDYDTFLDVRREDNVQTILSKLNISA